MSTTHTLTLAGCAPVPLAHYLKALGILRLVSEQKDPNATGRWHRDQFVLTSTLDREALLKFFSEEYQPTPVSAPWNNDAGYFADSRPAGKAALKAVEDSECDRLANYRASIAALRAAVAQCRLTKAPKDEDKFRLLQECRNQVSDNAIRWLDSAAVLTEAGARYPAIFGTGGGDGSLEFTKNLLLTLDEVFDFKTGNATKTCNTWLSSALFQEATPAPPKCSPIGQFFPSATGGVNATSGFESDSAINPWDYILLIEGALLFAGGVMKVLETSSPGRLSYPFAVQQVGAGYGSSAAKDEQHKRPVEMWLPLWPKPTTYSELALVFAEGRAQVGGRQAKSGVDFARAVATLGTDRGFSAFQRFGFLKRNGDAYFATPLSRVNAKNSDHANLLNDLDRSNWLEQFRRSATKEKAPASVRKALSILESSILDLCISHTPYRLSAVFLALGQCEAAIARSLKWAKDNYLQPLFGLRKEWLNHGWNSSVEFRLAASLASISGKFGKDWLPMRCHLEQVDSYFDKESGTLSFRWADVPSNHVQWSEAALPNVLNAIASRRLILTEEPPQVRSEVWASISDIKAFIEGETNDALLSDLLWSMSLINWREKVSLPSSPTERQPVAPTLYALLKLCFPPVRSAQPDGILPVPAVPAIHRHAAQGSGDQAATMAIRRLRASGYHPALRSLPLRGDYARRTAAALLFPISDHTLTSIHRQTTRPDQEPANA